MLPNFIGSRTVSMIAPWSYKGDHEEAGSGVPKRCGTGRTSGKSGIMRLAERVGAAAGRGAKSSTLADPGSVEAGCQEKLAQWLEHEHPDAAQSLRERMAECSTINRLDVPISLHRCLATTT